MNERRASLLERDRELTEFGDALALAQDGRGRVVLVEAPAGLGKTSLLVAACDAAVEAGFNCLRARATELERDFAYGCVRQLLEPVVARPSEAERDRLFAGAAGRAKPLFAPTGVPEPAPAADSAFSMLHGLYWLLDNIAGAGPRCPRRRRRPLVRYRVVALLQLPGAPAGRPLPRGLRHHPER